MSNTTDISKVAQAADNQWHAELVRVYGNAAGDARYDYRGHSTPLLQALAVASRAACHAEWVAVRVSRGETPDIGIESALGSLLA